jgi:hypothetical protein
METKIPRNLAETVARLDHAVTVPYGRIIQCLIVPFAVGHLGDYTKFHVISPRRCTAVPITWAKQGGVEVGKKAQVET